MSTELPPKKRKIEEEESTAEDVEVAKIKTEFHTEQGAGIGFPIRNLPQTSDTGVDESIFQLAAQVSGQIYAANSKEDFDFTVKETTVLWLDTHGNLREALPDFAVVVSGTTMILAWKGSGNITDAISDFSYSPVCSGRWANISTGIRVHSGFYSIVENDMATNEPAIFDAMKTHCITELILTGHSLGGGLAQVAQVAIEAELLNDNSPWKQYNDETPLKTKTVAFSAPMSILAIDDPADTKGHAFLKTIDKNSCTIVYSNDVVPRAPGYLGFVDSLVYDFLPKSVDLIKEKTNFLLGSVVSVFRLGKKLSEGYENLKESQQSLLKIFLLFRHYGKIIHYDNDAAMPVVYKDYGPDNDESKAEPDSIPPFRTLKWQDTPDVIGKAKHDHNMTVRGPGLADNIQESLIEAKLSYMDNVSILNNKNDVESGPVPVDNWEDCLKKAHENFVSASMGGVVVWDAEPKDVDFRQRKGVLWVKKDLPKLSNDADLEKGGGLFNRKPNRTTLWRTPALDDITK
mmetsp:Transcript_19681/g.29204  ORF Transcript_19681/g.29204 Transcript_19681/m.29204 type:complete len:516 (+) Transcript_19681:106-1653(+)